MRSQLIAEITNFDVASFDRLEEYAMAKAEADGIRPTFEAEVGHPSWRQSRSAGP